MSSTQNQVTHHYHIMNPAAGKKKKEQTDTFSENAVPYYTTKEKDAEEFVYSTCLTEPNAHFIVHGGDGTLHEVVNGIAKANALATATFTPVAAGSGNDFVRVLPTLPKDCYIDLLRYNDNYSLNMINIGFDCHVAERAARYKRKPLISGTGAYVAGILATLLHKPGLKMKITYTDENDNVVTLEDTFLLTVAANGRYCGGGFYSHPVADLQDGLMDVLLIKKISRPKFISLVSYYKKGTHLTKDGKVAPRFNKILTYVRCKEITIETKDILCADGEIEPMEQLKISVLPRALHLVQA